LELFDFNLPVKADQCINELKAKVAAIKYYAFAAEISFGKGFVHERLLKTLPELNSLMKALAPYSKSFVNTVSKTFNTWCTYDPIPAAAEPTSVDDMYYSVQRLSSDSRALRIRNKAILDEVGMVGDIYYDEYLTLLDQTVANLRKKLHGL
jgi:hypothetical protein